jgi:heme oxygenase
MTTRHVATRDADTSFSAALRAATWSDHQRAESSPFMDALMAGSLSRDAYADLLAQQWFAYRVLESAAEAMRADPVAGAFVHDELTRTPSLEADLTALLGDDWPRRVEPIDATAAYCDRLEAVCRTWPGGFVAHHYTRYLGDLSGGQFIGRVVRRTYGIDERSGAAFYHFPGIEDPKAFKDAYRDQLDAAPWDDDERARIIEEIRTAYRHNTEVLAQLRPR